VPPIISTAGSLLEVVGDCGLIVEPHDVNALAAAMTRMVEDPALRAELASRSCERAGSFTWQRCAQGTVDAYGRAAASSR
jgi:glycosyltransferase involved in cell wall biosynthesis